LFARCLCADESCVGYNNLLLNPTFSAAQESGNHWKAGHMLFLLIGESYRM